MFEKQPGQVVVALPVHCFSAFYIEGLVFFGIHVNKFHQIPDSRDLQIMGPLYGKFPILAHYWGPIVG